MIEILKLKRIALAGTSLAAMLCAYLERLSQAGR